MTLLSSFQASPNKKITIAQVVNNFESIASLTSCYLGVTITAKNFHESRPDIEWLQKFSMDKQGKISFTGTLNHQATMMQLKWLEKWTNAFIKKCSVIIQDLPNIIEEKHLTVDYLIKNSAA
jgi:hypothetical protein